jgi:hypothetical protein
MVSKTDLTESVREFAVEGLGVDLLGVAPVKRLEGGPEGGRPTDYMSNAKSVAEPAFLAAHRHVSKKYLARIREGILDSVFGR